VKLSFDVVVAGGGPAGSAAALALSRCDLSVALIEQDSYENRRVGETLLPMIRQQLAGLGIWERFLESGPLRSFGIRTAWETPGPRHQDFVQNPYGCGWHVDRARFDAMLAHAAAQAGAELFLSARVGSCSKGADSRWVLEVAQDGAALSLCGRMLADATGRKAMLASRLGGKAYVGDRLIGAVSFSEKPEIAQWTLIEAVENGWWYSAPLPGAGMVFAYMTDSDLWMERDWDERLRLAPLTFERAGCARIPDPFQIVSAASVVRQPVTGLGWMAIGDAALAFDPLSGQGVLKSIESGVRCSSAMAKYFDGDSTEITGYEAWVKETYESYLSTRAQFYSSVTRWPDSPFWKRRASGSG